MFTKQYHRRDETKIYFNLIFDDGSSHVTPAYGEQPYREIGNPRSIFERFRMEHLEEYSKSGLIDQL